MTNAVKANGKVTLPYGDKVATFMISIRVDFRKDAAEIKRSSEDPPEHNHNSLLKGA